MKHKWEAFFAANEPIQPVRCSVCGTIAMCTADWCDSYGIVNWEEKTAKRDDCPGKNSV